MTFGSPLLNIIVEMYIDASKTFKYTKTLIIKSKKIKKYFSTDAIHDFNVFLKERIVDSIKHIIKVKKYIRLKITFALLHRKNSRFI